MSENLFPHLNEVDEQAQHLLDTMIPPMAKSAGATEQLKATDQMRWVGLMNATKAQAEEIIFMELVYNKPLSMLKKHKKMDLQLEVAYSQI